MSNGDEPLPAPTGLHVTLSKARAGDLFARDQLFELYRPYLKLLCRRMAPVALKQRCDYSEIVQQTCVDAVKSIDSFRGKTEAEFSGWITQILRSNVVDEYRDLHRDMPLDVTEGSALLRWHSISCDEPDPDANALRGEAALAVAAALGELPEANAIAVTLRYIDGMKLAEVAVEMERTVGAVAGLVRRGIERLNRLLPEHLLST